MKSLPVFFALLFLTGFLQAQTSFLTFRTNEWLELRTDPSLTDHLQNLNPDERPEQLRDWLMLAVIQRFENKDEALESAFDIPPMRYDYQHDLEPFRFGEGRWLPTKAGQLIVFSPAESPRRKVNLARAADDYRLLRGNEPNSIHLFEYQFADEASPNRFRYAGQVDVGAVFKAEYGYVEHTFAANDRAALSAFLAAADDVVFVKKSGSRYTFGARRFAGYKMKGATLEDVAAVAQAGNDYENQLRERIGKRRLYSEYEAYIADVTDQIAAFCEENRVSDVAGLEIVLKPGGGGSVRYEKNSFLSSPGLFFERGMGRSLKPAIAARCREIMPYEKYENDYIGEQAADTDNYNFGFSLDHTLRQKAMSTDLDRIVRGDSVFHRRWFNEYLKPQFMRELAGDDNGLFAGTDSLGSFFELLFIEPVFIGQRRAVAEFSATLSAVSKDLRRDEPRLLYKLLAFLEGNADVSRASSPDAVDVFIENQIALVKTEAGIAKTTATAARPDRETWKNWLDQAPTQGDRLRSLRTFLYYFKLSHTYQKARYDGNFRGTTPGMTMFYTDLVMKLWSFNYKKSAPEAAVPGFFAQTSTRTSPLYHDNIEEKNQTRSWLGLLENSYDVHGGNQLFFSHWATRIFNASPNDLTPGQETEANVSASRFANWWNNHFSQVADYEPEYHHLNQLMKWTQIVFFMKNNGDFGFLDRETVRRNLDFEKWYAAQTDLTTQVSIPFLDKTELGERVECLDVLQSESYTAFHDLDVAYSFTGGVSLGTKGSMRARMAASTRPTRAPHRTDLTVKRSSSGSGGGGTKVYQAAKKSEYTVAAPRRGKTDVTVKRAADIEFGAENTTLQGKNFEWSTSVSRRSVEASDNGLEIGIENTGRLNVRRDGKAVLVSFKEGKVAKADRVFRNIDNAGDLEAGIVESGQFEQIFKLPGKKEVWLGRFRETGEWMQFERMPKPSGKGFEFAAGTGRTWGNGKKYVGGKFVSESEATRMTGKYGWQKLAAESETPGILELAEAPAVGAKKYRLSFRGKESEITWAEDGIYLRNQPESAETANLLTGRHAAEIPALRRQMTQNPGSAILSRTPEGEILGISESGLPTGLTNRFKIMTDGVGESGIRTAVFQKNGTAVRVSPRGSAVELPMNATLAQENIAAFVIKRTDENPTWRPVFSSRLKIETADVEVLKKIHPNNNRFGSTYFEMEYSVGRLTPEECLLRYDHAPEAPQMLVRDAAGCRVLDIPASFRSADVEGIGAAMRRFYEDPTNKMSIADIRKITEPLADYLRAVEKNTAASRIVVMEGEGLNSGTIANLHGLGKRFFKDVPDLALSLSHVRDTIYPDAARMIFISTVEWDDPRYPGLEQMRDSMERLGIRTLAATDRETFEDAVGDEANSQIFLLADTDVEGLVFEDETLEYSDFALTLEAKSLFSEQRDFLYAMTANSAEMERSVANSRLFSYTVTSQMLAGEGGNVAESMALTLGFAEEAVGEEVDVKAKTLKKILKKYPAWRSALESVSTKIGKTVNLKLGQLSAEVKRRFDDDALLLLRGGKTAKPGAPAAGPMPDFPTLDRVLNKAQNEGLRTAPATSRNASGWMRAIINYKVQIDKPDPRVARTC